MSPVIPRARRVDLPENLPIFPLSGVLLLPRGRLPLNIFEPRYLNMTDDALAGGRTVGIVQPLETASDPIGETAEVYETGCAGRVTSFSETPDGRYLITLTGLSRFRIASELDLLRGYRRVVAEYGPFASDLEEDPGRIGDRPGLMAAVRTYFEVTGIEADFEALEAASNEALVTALAMICPLEPRDKQALLEARGVEDRSALLTSLLTFAVQGNTTSGETRH